MPIRTTDLLTIRRRPASRHGNIFDIPPDDSSLFHTMANQLAVCVYRPVGDPLSRDTFIVA